MDSASICTPCGGDQVDVGVHHGRVLKALDGEILPILPGARRRRFLGVGHLMRWMSAFFMLEHHGLAGGGRGGGGAVGPGHQQANGQW